MLRYVAETCCSYFYSNNVSTELRETLEEGTSNNINAESREPVNVEGSTYQVLNGTAAAPDSWIGNCHQQITAFISNCGQGVRRCTDSVFAFNSPASINFVCSPASITAAGVGGIIGAALGRTLYMAHGYDDVDGSIGAMFCGAMLGAGLSYFLVGPFFYQLKVGSWAGLCARENPSDGSDV